MKRDYYEVLGLSRSASDADIKKAFKRLAIKYHPDRNKEADAAECFREANEAYQVLSDESLRRAYDMGGFTSVNQERSKAEASGRDPFARTYDEINEILREIYAKRARRYQQAQQRRQHDSNDSNRGRDMRVKLEISLHESIVGTTKEMSYKAPFACAHCQGTGVRNQQECSFCHGTGRQTAVRRIKVKVPEYAQTGQAIVFNGQGEAGLRGGASGDLRVVIAVKPDSDFTLEGNNVLYNAKISFTKAALGGKVMVPSFDRTSKYALTIKPCTQTGKVFRLRGKGLPAHGVFKEPGDMLVTVVVTTPSKITPRMQELFTELEQEELNAAATEHAAKAQSGDSSKAKSGTEQSASEKAAATMEAMQEKASELGASAKKGAQNIMDNVGTFFRNLRN